MAKEQERKNGTSFPTTLIQIPHRFTSCCRKHRYPHQQYRRNGNAVTASWIVRRRNGKRPSRLPLNPSTFPSSQSMPLYTINIPGSRHQSRRTRSTIHTCHTFEMHHSLILARISESLNRWYSCGQPVHIYTYLFANLDRATTPSRQEYTIADRHADRCHLAILAGTGSNRNDGRLGQGRGGSGRREKDARRRFLNNKPCPSFIYSQIQA